MNKYKLLSGMFAVFFILFSASFVSAATLNVNPNHLNERNIIIKAADRIIQLQYTDGSWDWDVTNQNGPTGTTYYNIAGVTGEVLIDAYKLTHDSKYLDAAKKAGDYIVATPISTTQRQNAYTIVFLYHLVDVSGDTQYSTKALNIFNHITSEVNYWSVNNGNHCADDAVNGCTASELIAAYKNYRAGEGDPAGIVAWDIAPFVEAGKLSGNNLFAQNIANEIKSYLDQVTYVGTTSYYELGLSTGIRALNIMGMDYSSYLTKLLAKQDVTGYFSSPNYPNEKTQSTAYALIALKSANNANAAHAASYLSTNFGYGSGPINGWLDDTTEYSEVTSEAAQALFDYIYQPNTYYTIQDAINAASSGDTINIAAGTYTENVNVDKSLTLKGASSATVTVNAANPAVSVFYVTASSVKISGFTITGANVATTAGIYLGNDVTLCNIFNNVLTGNGDGIWLGAGSNHNTLTSNTLSSNYQGFEIYFSDYNTFTNNIANSNTQYGFVMLSASHNTFTGNTANSNGQWGFYLKTGPGTGCHYNTFTNNIANSNTVYGMRINSGIGNTLTDNTFDSNLVAAIRLKDDISTLTLNENRFTNSPIGIDIATVATDVTTWIVSHNNIAGNIVYGVSNLGTGTLNAENNWWGSSTGPYHPTLNPTGLGNPVSDNVAFDPWSKLSTTITSPDEGEYFGIRRVLLEVSTDSLVADKIEYSLNGGPFKKLCSKCNSYSSSIGFLEGENTIVARSTLGSESSDSKPVTFYIDTKKPNIAKQTPTNNKYTNGTFVVVYTEKNLQGVTLYYKGTTESGDYHHEHSVGCVGGTKQQCVFKLYDTFKTLYPIDGTKIKYYFVVSNHVTDTTSKTFTETVDTSIPGININSPTSETNTRKVLFDISGIGENVKLQYFDNNKNPVTLCSSCSLYKATRTFTVGYHDLKFIATDKAGNVFKNSVAFTIV